MDTEELRRELGSTLWYHTMELAPGIESPGWFDMRPVSEILPWPDVKGKRCLDVGTYDGYLAFEMERRGASEVIAIDVDDHAKWDWPPDARAEGPGNLAKIAGTEKGRGFKIAAEALGSKVERRWLTVYELDPKDIGTFDVVVCGSLLLHLRDPLRALEAIRSVCSGYFLSAEQIDLPLTLLFRRRPVMTLNGTGPLLQWTIPNAAGHRQQLWAAGFEILRSTKPYAIPFGPSHPKPEKTARDRIRSVMQRTTLGRLGVPSSASLTRPRV